MYVHKVHSIRTTYQTNCSASLFATSSGGHPPASSLMSNEESCFVAIMSGKALEWEIKRHDLCIVLYSAKS